MTPGPVSTGCADRQPIAAAARGRLVHQRRRPTLQPQVRLWTYERWGHGGPGPQVAWHREAGEPSSFTMVLA